MNIDAATLERIKNLSTPDGYAEHRLGMNLHPTHREVLKSVFAKQGAKVSFRAGNSVGKSSTVATAAALYAIEARNALVVCTSATYRQLTKQLVMNLKRFNNTFSNWEFLESSIKVNGESKYIGVATDRDSTFQGWHATDTIPLLIIVDEAAGVKDEIFQSIGRCKPTWLLIMGSPLGPEGVFYSIETDANMYGQFDHHKLSQLDCTKDKGYWLDKKEIEDFINLWTINSPLVRSSVFAEFSETIEGGIISLSDIESCIRTPAIPDNITEGKHVALDFAAGGDSNVISFRHGNEVKVVKIWREKDTMSACAEFINQLDNLKKQYNIQPSDVSGDADGLGGPMIDRLKELGWPINRYHGNTKSVDAKCKNRITDDWINLCKRIRNRNIIIPDNQELKLQLTSRKSYMNSNGLLQLESKEDMRSRGIPSPDIADSVAMACGQCQNGVLSFIKPANLKVKSYSGYF